MATATSAVAARPGRGPGPHRADGAVHRRPRRARRQGRSQPAGRPGRAGRRPPDRRKRPEPPRAPAESARFGRPLGDLRPMAIRSDEITSIIKSAIDAFDAGRRDPQRRHRRRGRRRDRPDLRAGRRAVVRAARVPRRGDGHGPQPRGGDGRRGHPGRRHRDQGRRHGQDHRSRRRGPGRRRRCSAGSSTRSGRPLDDKGPIAVDRDAPGRADRPGRHRPPGRRHAGPDRASRRSTR